MKGSLSVHLPDQDSPTPHVPRKRCHGAKLVRYVWQLNLEVTIPPSQTSPTVGRVPLLSAQLTSWTSASIAFHPASLTFLVRLYLGYSIHSHNSSNYDSPGNGDWSRSQILHHDCNSFATCGHLAIGIHDTQAMR